MEELQKEIQKGQNTMNVEEQQEERGKFSGQ